MDSELVLERRDANVLWLTLNQPEKRNPLSSEMIATLSGLLEKGYADETVRAIVLASAASPAIRFGPQRSGLSGG